MSSVLRGAAHNVTKPRRKSAAKSPAKAAQQKSSSRDGLVIDIDSCLVHETTKGKKRTRDWGDEDAPKAAPKSARKTDVLSSVAGALGWLGGYADTPISLAASNPKRAGSRAWDRYEAYKHAKTWAFRVASRVVVVGTCFAQAHAVLRARRLGRGLRRVRRAGPPRRAPSLGASAAPARRPPPPRVGAAPRPRGHTPSTAPRADLRLLCSFQFARARLLTRSRRRGRRSRTT